MRISDWSSDVCSSDLFLDSVEYDVIPAKIAVHRLERFSSDTPIMVELETNWEIKLFHLFSLVGLQSNGEQGGELRSEERRVGKACDSTCRYRCSTYH